MIHELLGIHEGRVDLSAAKDATSEMKRVVFASAQDEIFAKDMYMTYGDVRQTSFLLMQSFRASGPVNLTTGNRVPAS